MGLKCKTRVFIIYITIILLCGPHDYEKVKNSCLVEFYGLEKKNALLGLKRGCHGTPLRQKV